MPGKPEACVNNPAARPGWLCGRMRLRMVKGRDEESCRGLSAAPRGAADNPLQLSSSLPFTILNLILPHSHPGRAAGLFTQASGFPGIEPRDEKFFLYEIRPPDAPKTTTQKEKIFFGTIYRYPHIGNCNTFTPHLQLVRRLSCTFSENSVFLGAFLISHVLRAHFCRRILGVKFKNHQTNSAITRKKNLISRPK